MNIKDLKDIIAYLDEDKDGRAEVGLANTDQAVKATHVNALAKDGALCLTVILPE